MDDLVVYLHGLLVERGNASPNDLERNYSYYYNFCYLILSEYQVKSTKDKKEILDNYVKNL